MYDHMNPTAGKAVCLKDWEVTGRLGGVKKGLKELAHIDPSNDIDPLASVSFENEDPLDWWIRRIFGGFEESLVDSKNLWWIRRIFGGFEESLVDSKNLWWMLTTKTLVKKW